MTTSRLYQRLNDGVDRRREERATPEQSVAPATTEKRNQTDLLETIMRRRRDFKPKEYSLNQHSTSQYFSVLEAAKAGCNLESLRKAIGEEHGLAKNLIERLIDDRFALIYPKVQAVKQEFLLEVMEAYHLVLQDVNILAINLSTEHGNDITIEDLFNKLFIQKWLTRSHQKNTFRDYTQDVFGFQAKLESELYGLLKAFVEANGSLKDERLLNVMPLGTACKLIKTLSNEIDAQEASKKLQDEQAANALAETQQALNLFR